MSRKTEFGPIARHVGFQIHLTWRAIRKQLLGKVRDAGDERVSRGTWSVPILIGLNPGISPQELARALHLDASKVALLLGGLEDEGLIRRSQLDTDRRRVTLTLTPEGEEFARVAQFRSEIIESPVAEAITTDELDELVRILGKIRAASRQ